MDYNMMLLHRSHVMCHAALRRANLIYDIFALLKANAIILLMSHDAIINNHCVKNHVLCYLRDRQEYLSAIYAIYSQPVILKSLTLTGKVKVLLVLLSSGEFCFLEQIYSYIDLPDIEKTCRILDAGRKRRQLERKLLVIRKKSKVHALTRELKQLKSFQVEYNCHPFKATLTKRRRIAVMNWTRSIPADQLQYRAYLFKTDIWRSLADMCHLSPRRDFQLEWFLGYCFGNAPPKGSLVYILETATTQNFNILYTKYDLPYECIRIALKKNLILEHQDKIQIIQKESLKNVLWNWKDLSCPIGDEILCARLYTSVDSQLAELTYGKLVDSILNCPTPKLRSMLIKIAEKKLQQYACDIEQPVAVLCDASESMHVAIITSAIITSMLSVVSKAELQIFRHVNETVTQTPVTVDEAIKFAKTIRAHNLTSPASSMMHYYASKTVIKTFIIITDEEENTSYTGLFGHENCLAQKGYFAELYQRYITDIYPAKLVFISFSRSKSDGKMVTPLKSLLNSNNMELVTVHKIDLRNPDMNRLDYVLEGLRK